VTESNPLESVSNKYNADNRDTLIPIDNSWSDWVSSYNLTYFHTIKLNMSGHKGKFRTVCLYSNYLLLGFTDEILFFSLFLLVCFIHFWLTILLSWYISITNFDINDALGRVLVSHVKLGRLLTEIAQLYISDGCIDMRS